MGYLHIDNLYKNQEIFIFKDCYALEKIHGTSAHIKLRRVLQVDPMSAIPVELQAMTAEVAIEISFFAGGASHEQFVKLFDMAALMEKFAALEFKELTIYGEAYGGKMQGMSATYGPTLKFVVFDLWSGNKEEGWWLSVPAAEHFTKELGLEFVDYVKIPATVEACNAERDKNSIQAIRNGMGEGRIREGVVLRPLKEYRISRQGGRVISKHKRDEFKETKTKRDVVVDPNYLKVLEDAQMIADEWVTPMRLEHVLGKLDPMNEDLGIVIRSMIEDVEREGAGEIVVGKETRGAISKLTVKLYKERQQAVLRSSQV